MTGWAALRRPDYRRPFCRRPVRRVRAPVRAASLTLAGCALALSNAPGDALAQDPGEPREVPRITVTWRAAPIQEVMLTLADVSGRSIVVGGGVTGFVTATIEDQPWDATLEAIARSQGLVVAESESGILRIEPFEAEGVREASDALVTHAYRIRYVPAAELQPALAGVLSERGTIGVATSTNTLVVTDVPRVHAAIARLLR